MIDKFWMIAEVSEAQPSFAGDFLLRHKAPRAMHYGRDDAEKELLRLQKKDQTGEFVLLEAVAVAVEIPNGFHAVTPIEP